MCVPFRAVAGSFASGKMQVRVSTLQSTWERYAKAIRPALTGFSDLEFSFCRGGTWCAGLGFRKRRFK